jgi:hypothetical protein
MIMATTIGTDIGWKSDFQDPHNIGKGSLFWHDFRQWMMHHVGINPQTMMQRDPCLIIISQASSTKPNRKDIKFEDQMSILRKKFCHC